MYSDLTWEKRQYERQLARRVRTTENFIDVGVTLRVVCADPNGEQLIPGAPKLRVLNETKAGWVIDTQARRICGESSYSRVWYCSEQQYPLILHRKTLPLGLYVRGSEGSGKTSTTARWIYFRWLEALFEGREGGIVAPTNRRLRAFLRDFRVLFAGWFDYVKAENLITLCDGTRLQMVSSHQRSADEGSPIQSFSWSFAAGDEDQDQTDRHADIEARGRSAKERDGVVWYRQLRTCTPKDAPKFRTHVTVLRQSGRWGEHVLLGRNSPFVGADHWERLKATMSDREYRRRVLAEDVGPERATYPAWSRDKNMIPVPQLGWENVTERELAKFGPNRALQVGHDPGTLVDVSLWLHAFVRSSDWKMYERGVVRPFWVVRGELNTEGNTTEFHIQELLKIVRMRYALNLLTSQGKPNPHGRQMLVRADPSGNSDNRTDKSVYTQFANAGIHIKPAAYNTTNDGHGRVPKNAGIELVNTLFCSAAGERRLYVEQLPDGRPAAPMLVHAIETSQRDSDGKAEAQRKDEHDVSHWPAALRYALWAIERPRLQALIDRKAQS